MLRTASNTLSDLASSPTETIVETAPTGKTAEPTPALGRTARSLTADEAALAERLSPVLAHGVRRAPVPEPSKRHVSLSAEPEEAVLAPPMGSDAEDLLPPPLPDAGTWTDGTWTEADGDDLSVRAAVPRVAGRLVAFL